jgi:haloacetate dehalogenase
VLFPGFSARRIATSSAEINLVTGGSGPPLLLLHGYPQTHAMWHRVAPRLAQRFTVVATDLRGYGDSAKPAGGDRNIAYSKRAMAQDQVEVMAALGHSSFYVAAHDRGARVAHRLALDHPQAVKKLAVLDIVPTRMMYAASNQVFATAYFHWYFLIQPAPFPETLIGANPDFFIKFQMGRRHGGLSVFDPEAMEEYLRCFRDPAAIHASCEDYRAAAGIDLEHDAADAERKVECPLLALWGRHGVIELCFDALADWSKAARDVRGQALDCGHYLAEEKPGEVAGLLEAFLQGTGAGT